MEQKMLLVGRSGGVAYVPLNPSSKMKAIENKRKGGMRYTMSLLLQSVTRYAAYTPLDRSFISELSELKLKNR
jgi:hypothetical protein